MKHVFKILAAFLSVFLILCCCACTNENSSKLAGFSLGHYDAAETEEMDSKYFYRNDLKLIGGDADIEWIPADRDQEYGGYYYLYTSGNIANGHNTYWKDGAIQSVSTREEGEARVDHKSIITCLRSKDMNDWELCGAVDNGFAGYLEGGTWIQDYCWAPEIIYDANTAKYYLYCTARAYSNSGKMTEETQYANTSTYMYDRFYVCVLESDTPVGPFRQVESESYYASLSQEQMNEQQRETYERTGLRSDLNGKVLTYKNPTINFTYDLGLEGEVFSVIDMSPFFDDDGVLYLSFVRHASTGHKGQCTWIMRMKDMITPDYDTLTKVFECNYEYVTAEGLEGATGKERADESKYKLHNCFAIPAWATYAQDLKAELEAAMSENNKSTIFNEETQKNETWTRDNGGTWVKDGWSDEGGVNEGPHMWKEGNRYYLMYSPLGFSAANYDARQTISDSSVFGPYYKLPTMPGAIMSRGFNKYINSYMSGTGHHAFVESDGELFCIYHAHADPATGDTSATDGRFYAFDRVQTIEDETYGTLLAGVGPTQTVQPKPSTYTGLRNVAGEATISATNCDENTVKYLNDDFFVCHEYYADREFVANGQTTITLKFDKPVTVSALMVYNTLDYEYAFSGVDSIIFRLAESPEWIDQAFSDVRECYIEDVGFSEFYIDPIMMKIRTGAAAAASFEEITVTEISINISKTIAEMNRGIKISDIVVLGK